MLKLAEDKFRVLYVPYDPELLSFEHNGVEISNPFLSECGRFAVDPVEAYGFTVALTVDGGKALEKALPDGGFIRLTDEYGSGLPDLHDVDSAQIGRFDAIQQIATCSMSEVRMCCEMDMDEEQVAAPVSRGPGL